MATIEYRDEFVIELRTNAARNPALPVRPLTAREVAVAVRYAADEGVELPFDLSAMKRIVVDTGARTARAQPGVTRDELARLVERNGFVLADAIAAHVV